MKFRKSVFFFFSFLILPGCVNGYKKYYVGQPGATPEAIASARENPPPQTPYLERAGNEDVQGVKDYYAQKGYVSIGYSVFTASKEIPEDGAMQQAKDVGADLVVVIDPKYLGSVTRNMPITLPTTTKTNTNSTATAYGPNGTATAFGTSTTTTTGTQTSYIPVTQHSAEFGAIYFIKRKIIFGTINRDLNTTEREKLQTNKGVVATLVIDSSPAYFADIFPNDIIVSVDGFQISNEESLSKKLEESAGKVVEISLLRNYQKISKQVQLNKL